MSFINQCGIPDGKGQTKVEREDTPDLPPTIRRHSEVRAPITPQATIWDPGRARHGGPQQLRASRQSPKGDTSRFPGSARNQDARRQ
jgi:hypothetical protein